ncbi:MAG TPA: DUF6069 family protein, partial [Jiangellaceae bacterium]
NRSSTVDSTSRSFSERRVAAIGAAVATVANVALWAGGRAADVGFLVNPVVGDPFQVGVVLVILTTVLMFAVGWAVLALAARRSRRWVRAVLVTAAAVAVVSALGGPLPTADDTATGMLLAAMHLITGAVFVATAVRARIG